MLLKPNLHKYHPNQNLFFNCFKSLIVIFLLLATQESFSQSKASYSKDLGLFGNILGVDVRAGLTTGVTYRPKGEYIYRLNQNATVYENRENQWASNISMSLIIPFNEEGDINFLLSIAFKEFKHISTDDNAFFNSQTPFGMGFAYFPFKRKVVGFSALVNLGNINRLPEKNTDANPNDKTFFPIADHPDDNLKVDAPVPDKLLEQYYKHDFSYSVTGAIIIKF